MIHNNDYTSAVGWIDFSSEHREKVKTVLDLLGTPGVVDELGVGVIRDSFSDSLFPGISTIQTRAKYFLTLPRIFSDYQQLKLQVRRRRSLSEYLKEQENVTMASLDQNHKNNSDPQDGIIGVSFAGKKGEVQRKPSSVYWNGLRTFGIVTTQLSLKEFVMKFANPTAALHDLIEGNDDTRGDDPDAVESVGPSINTSSYSDQWQDSLTLHLNFDEATFLARQIETSVPDSLLGQILMDDDIRKTFTDLPDSWEFIEFCEEAPFIHNLDDDLRQVIHGAKDFWQLLEGAHIRYNVLLQAKHGTTDKENEFEDQWQMWSDKMQQFPWDRWDIELLWNLAIRHHRQVKQSTQQFVIDWITQVQINITDLDRLNLLVTQQERLNKRARARLKENAEESVSKWIGISTLDYRYSQARTIIKDIHFGLTKQQEEANA